MTVRAGHADDSEACEQFVQELAAMYVGWADTRGMRIRRGGDADKVVLEVSGLGAYTLLKPETGLHVLELPVPERSFDRATVIVSVEPADGTATGRRTARSLSSSGATGTNRRLSSATRTERAPAGSTAWRGDFDLY